MTQLVPQVQPAVTNLELERPANRLGSFITRSPSFILGLVREYFWWNLKHCKSKPHIAQSQLRKKGRKKNKSNTTRREGEIFSQATNSEDTRRIYELVVKLMLMESSPRYTMKQA